MFSSLPHSTQGPSSPGIPTLSGSRHCEILVCVTDSARQTGRREDLSLQRWDHKRLWLSPWNLVFCPRVLTWGKARYYDAIVPVRGSPGPVRMSQGSHQSLCGRRSSCWALGSPQSHRQLQCPCKGGLSQTHPAWALVLETRRWWCSRWSFQVSFNCTCRYPMAALSLSEIFSTISSWIRDSCQNPGVPETFVFLESSRFE